MATANFVAIDAHSTVGEYKVSIDYDDVSLLINDANVDNSTGDSQPITVGTFSSTIADGTHTQVALATFNQHMVNTPRGPRPPVFIG